ncbi:MAG TPA: L,D-transpeptidase [Thermoanaerobaculia bacterium]|nr:L,D-transpeptidase [Thermoanaerobaculia bacterium]
MQIVKIPFDPPYYYIHGTDVPESMGQAASHGCIRMRPEDAAELAKTIMELTGDGRDERWYEEVLERRQPTEVALARPVELVVLESVAREGDVSSRRHRAYGERR